jgi:hypothetical protein
MAGSPRRWFVQLSSCMKLATLFRTNQIGDSHENLGQVLSGLGKIPCDVKTVKGEARFQMWLDPQVKDLCQR